MRSDRGHATCDKDMHAIVSTLLPAPPSSPPPGPGEKRVSCWSGREVLVRAWLRCGREHVVNLNSCRCIILCPLHAHLAR